MTLTLVGIRDRQLEEALRASGVAITTISLAELPALAQAAPAPDVVVVDLRNQSQLPSHVGLLKRQHPSCGVGIVMATLDPTLMVEAMRAGVTECVTTMKELEEAINRLMTQRAAPETSEVYVFVGAKGGVGTTTAAVNVATALGKVAPTLVVDLHLTGSDAALLLGADPRFSVVDALENIHRLDTAFFRGLLARSKAGVDLLASPDRAASGVVDGGRVKALIDSAARLYRYVVLDVSRFDAVTLDAVDAATKIVVVANQELATLRAATRLTSMLGQRYGKQRIYVVLGRSDRLSHIAIDDIERTLGMGVKHMFPSDYRLALDAMNGGRPIMVDNHTALASAYQACARDLAGLVGEKKQAEQRPGRLIGRLRGRW